MKSMMKSISPRLQTIRDLKVRAIDAGDRVIVEACSRLQTADLLGWKRHHDPRDWKLVTSFLADLEA